MATVENLKPVKTEAEARRKGRNGGIASGKAKRAKKTMRQTLEMVMSLDIKSTTTKKKLKELGIADKDLINQTVGLVAIYQKMLKGDVRAAEYIRDTMGQKPRDEVSIEDKRRVEVIDDLPSTPDKS